MKQFTQEFAKRFKRSYAYKMGGTQTIVLPNGQEFQFNDREYYSGRGSKYNNSVKHDALGRIEVTKKQVAEARKEDRERAKRMKELEAERKAKAQRIEAAKSAGVYNIEKKEYGTFVELSDEESTGRYFDTERLARTLNISVADAELLKSEGKTYVFAKTAHGKILELYHSTLSCNYLSISVEEVSEERLKEFNHDEWANAPFAGLLGQTESRNHFVC
jgi:antirestriction protein